MEILAVSVQKSTANTSEKLMNGVFKFLMLAASMCGEFKSYRSPQLVSVGVHVGLSAINNKLMDVKSFINQSSYIKSGSVATIK